jgi:hypothetical protein
MTHIVAVPPIDPRNIGKCIYCGEVNDLSKEHILPHGLGGPWVLLKASCKKCAKITSAFEYPVVHELFDLVRTKLSLPTYHPKDRPKSHVFSLKSNGKDKIVESSIIDSPTLFVMPIFEKPGCILNNVQRKGVLITGTTLHGSGVNDYLSKQGSQTLSYSVNLSTSFARVLAKIAYGMVVFKYGIDVIQDVYVLPCILGTKDDAGQWVGCEDPEKSPALLPKEQLFHKIEVFEKNDGVYVKIRLFASSQTPEYLVIVGKLKNHHTVL